MTDIPKDWVPLIAAIVAAMLTPIVTAIAGVVARVGLQNRIARADYQLKRLDLVQKALAVESSFGGGKLAASSAVEKLKAEYQQIIAAISFETDERAKLRQVAPRRKGWRSIFPPKPLSIVGWLLTLLYYYYAVSSVMYVALLILAVFTERREVEPMLLAV